MKQKSKNIIIILSIIALIFLFAGCIKYIINDSYVHITDTTTVYETIDTEPINETIDHYDDKIISIIKIK